MATLPLPTVLPTLHGRRVLLRAMADDDAAGLHAIYSDPRVMQFTDELPFPDRQSVDIMLASVRRLLAEGTSLEWAIALADTDAIIGTCGLHHFDARQAEAGGLLRHSAWGQGYMRDAMALLMKYAGDVLCLDRLIADVALENERAQRMFKKLGYRKDSSGMLAIALRPRVT
ncbi:N-acetyltransferase [Massilia atriviolacea]|uniref:N-acetyltransferase n=1 Tax=Massilia atriviolacea TaxID=2495579 RepID=A0A430HFD9_9BURK|nr:GNAT family N-acetyltransferase [Massilia atriviolacea]RSZ56248.1 N-acetyltransferase [Massilia atriviolacea]